MPEMPAPPPMPEMPAPPPMPEMPAPAPMPEIIAPSPMSEPALAPVVANASTAEDVELPDPMAALDLLSSTAPANSTPDIQAIEETVVTDDLFRALDTKPVEDEDTETVEDETEVSVADYKWKDTVLDSIIAKFEIADRDAFLVHATAFDANKNLYLTKNELTEAAKEWVEMTTPIADLEPVEAESESVIESIPEPTVVIDEAIAAPPMPETPEMIQPSVIDAPPLPAPASELPPLQSPPPAMELPPLPSPPPAMELPPLPSPPPAMELPPLPSPTPAPEATVQVQAVSEAETPAPENTGNDQTEDYRELWKRRSDKSLPQMYGAIDRIGSGEIGSLLDRYSDRFGHELDREIIVMRRAEQDARREAVPVVELISAPEEDEEESELQSQLNDVESILRPLQKAYKSADSNAEKKRLAPALKALIAERKILISVISGEADEDALEDIPERPEIPDYDGDDEDVVDTSDEFAEFFNVINQLLGDMPEDWVSNFVESNGFALFQEIGADPSGASEKSRQKFFNMINNELGSMPEDMLDAFVASPEFELYKTIGEKYGE
ncbi:MAG: Uncharacterised protein [Marine Group II euryarchaeote MED-G33]|nr:MAG: Uncharacterised protein [Marine Group II euryarchaeote MED-G33]